MADQPTQPVTKVHTTPLESGVPSAHTQTIFADGVANLAPSVSVVKFYLYRSDPEQTGKPEYKNQVFAQVIMPVGGFLQAAALFEKGINQFVAQGTISPELVTLARKSEGL
jgi:hypothetical protein